MCENNIFLSLDNTDFKVSNRVDCLKLENTETTVILFFVSVCLTQIRRIWYSNSTYWAIYLSESCQESVWPMILRAVQGCTHLLWPLSCCYRVYQNLARFTCSLHSLGIARLSQKTTSWFCHLLGFYSTVSLLSCNVYSPSPHTYF